MANLVRVRVVIDPKLPPDIAWKKLQTTFRNECKDANVQRDYKQHQTYESKSRKKRRKERESEIVRLKNKLRDNFSQQGRNNE